MQTTIYFLLPDLAAGGAERVTITFARILRGEGKNVEFVNLGKHEGDILSWIEPEFKITSFGCERVLKAIPLLFKFMSKHPNGIYFSSREHVTIVGLITAKLGNKQIVVRVPNMPKNVLTKGVSGVKSKLIKFINSFLLKSAKTIIAQNEEMRDQLLEYYKLPTEKVVTIYNPVDKEYVLKSAENSPCLFDKNEVNFLNVCNIAYSKGIDILEEAWSIVKNEIPNAHMYIVGRVNSDYAKEIVKKSKELKDFTFLGFQCNPYPYLKFCDVFVLSSRMEGFPNVVLEAMCFNRPIVSTTCVDVIKEIINEGINGYYCEIENPKKLADCMLKAVRLNNIDNNYNMFDRQMFINLFSR